MYLCLVFLFIATAYNKTIVLLEISTFKTELFVFIYNIRLKN